MKPLQWFSRLFGDADSGWLTVSFKRDSSTRNTPDDPFSTDWFHAHDLESAAGRAAGAEGNVYFGLGLRRTRLGVGQRGCASDVCALPGVWVEIDVAGGTHEGSGKTYFPDKTSALEWLRTALPHRPTVIVDSGGGLHAYWLFHELWELEGQDDVEHAAAVVRGWQSYLKTRTSHDIDSTHDLARVLRVPGTMNCKNGSRRDVVVIEADGPRYDPSDFEDWIELSVGPTNVEMPKVALRGGAEPPGLKFTALMDDRKFRDTWNRQRKDLADQSPSAYCLSLATTAALAGWSDQEITDLLVAWRRQQQAQEKRPGWYALTIAKARAGNTEQIAQQQAVQRLESTPEPDEKLASLSTLLGFSIRRIVRCQTLDETTGMLSSPWYRIETEKGTVEVPDAGVLISRPRFQTLIAGHLNHYVNVPAKSWPKVAQGFLDVVVDEEAPQEASPYAHMRGLVLEYAGKRPSTDDPVSAYDGKMILEHEGRRWFSLQRFADWVRITKGESAGPRNLPRLLALAGCTKTTLRNLRRGDKTTMLTFWSVPDEG